jgi:hypothetical protein
MTEQEAIEIATKYINMNQVRHEGVDKAFFVPVSAFENAPPELDDSWTIHFKLPPVQEDESELLLSGERIIIVVVDVKTKKPSFVSQL